MDMSGRPRYRLAFPRERSDDLAQDEASFQLIEEGGDTWIRFHDYDQIYRRPCLYEQLFYDRLKCSSPRKVAQILQSAVAQSDTHFTELRVLDLGAGNGIMGEELKKEGVSRLVGVDIIPDAEEALYRDRPGVYDAYHTVDITDLDDDLRDDLLSWRLNTLVVVAALGFGDIPAEAFVEAMHLIETPGWIAFNIKETFLDRSDTTGFSQTLRELIFSKYIDVYHMERYRHRLSIDGEPLFYFAISGRKNADIPRDFLEHIAAIE
jgi:SAM-dependent methyltransferase